MKVAILSIALLCAAVSVSAEVVCKINGSLLPNPADCSTFYTCDNGVPKLTNCPPGLLFNPEALVCDHAANVNCEASSTTTSSPSSTATPESTTTSEPTTASESTTAETTTQSTTAEPTTPEPTTTELTTPEPTTSAPTSSETPTETTTQEASTTAEPTSTTTTTTTRRPWTTTTRKPTTTTSAPTTTTSAPNTTTSAPNTTTSAPNTTTSAPNTTTSAPTSTTSAPNTTTNAPTTTSSAPNTTTSAPTTTTNAPNTTTNAPTSTTPPTIPSGCPAEGSAIIANPADCASFVVCINGANTTVRCPPEMLFNPELNACDLADNVDCRVVEPTTTPEPTETTTEEQTTTETPETTTEVTTPEPTISTEEPTPDTTTEDQESTSENPGTTENPGYVPDCPEEGYAILENPESCGSFYVCVNGVSGLINCPAGLDFNPATNHCDLPADPNCRNPTEPPTTPDPYVPPCPENGTVQLPNPSDCSSFFICINSNYAKLSCPEDHHFNETLQKCIAGGCGANLFALADFQCEEDGSFPDPEDCSSYYVCAGNQVFLLHCPDGLHFDAELGTCNLPEVANCQSGSSTTTTSAPTTTTSAPTTTSTTTTSAPTTTTTSAPTTTSTSTTEAPTTSTTTTTGKPDNGVCPDSGVAVLPDPDDCTKFYVCIEGEYEVVECPDGYGFSEEEESCVPAELVGCGTTPKPTEPNCPSTGTVRIPNPDDCTSYYICISGNAALIHCPQGLNFDEESGNCSADAKCSIGSSTSKPTDAPTTSTSTVQPSDTPTTSTTTTKPTETTETSEGTTTSQGTTGNPSIVCKVEGELHPNPDSCTSFYQCANGQPILIDCPPGLEFNSEADVCDNPETANCSVKSRYLLSKILGLF